MSENNGNRPPGNGQQGYEPYPSFQPPNQAQGQGGPGYSGPDYGQGGYPPSNNQSYGTQQPSAPSGADAYGQQYGAQYGQQYGAQYGHGQQNYGQQNYGQQAYPPAGQPGGYPPQYGGTPPYGGGYGQEPSKGKGPLIAWIVLGILLIAGITVGVLFATGVIGGDDEDEAIVDTNSRGDGGRDVQGGDGTNNGGGTGDGKPSRDEVHAGIEKMLSEQLSAMGLTQEQIDAAGIGPAIDDYYTCVVDGIYDDVDVETLQIVAEGDPDAPVVGDQLELLTDASNACVESELEPAM